MSFRAAANLMDREPFFHLERTKQSLESIGSAEQITLVIGAGCSVDAGMESWPEVVKRLVRGLLQRRTRERPEVLRRTADYILRTYGLLAAAELVRTTTDKAAFVSILREALYGEVEYSVQPGRFATNAMLLPVTTTDCRILTTNYDDLLERAVLQYDVGVRGIPLTRNRRVLREGEIGVYHLHGYLPPNGKEAGEIILAERDYTRMQFRTGWQEHLFRECLRNSTCLFVGTSLSDPNLLRYLYQVADEKNKSTDSMLTHQHYAVLVRQQEDLFRDREIEVSYASAVESIVDDRLEELGIVSIRPDFFGQVPQFLYEIALRRRFGPGYMQSMRYGLRLTRWQKSMSEKYNSPSSHEEFLRSQEVIQSTLSKTLSDMRNIIGSRDDTELFSLHLWGRSHGDRTLELWGSSSAMILDARIVRGAPIDPNSKFHAVRAFCNGSKQIYSTSDEHTRWKVSMAQPIYLEDEPWYHLPVGVVTLSSTEDDSHASFRRLSKVKRMRLWRKLSEVGRLLLTP